MNMAQAPCTPTGDTSRKVSTWQDLHLQPAGDFGVRPADPPLPGMVFVEAQAWESMGIDGN